MAISSAANISRVSQLLCEYPTSIKTDFQRASLENMTPIQNAWEVSIQYLSDLAKDCAPDTLPAVQERNKQRIEKLQRKVSSFSDGIILRETICRIGQSGLQGMASSQIAGQIQSLDQVLQGPSLHNSFSKELLIEGLKQREALLKAYEADRASTAEGLANFSSPPQTPATEARYAAESDWGGDERPFTPPSSEALLRLRDLLSPTQPFEEAELVTNIVGERIQYKNNGS